jgi:hypothetical protein
MPAKPAMKASLPSAAQAGLGFTSIRRMLPSAAQIASAAEGRFVLEDWHSFGTDYDRTLQAWRDNVERPWPALAESTTRKRVARGRLRGAQNILRVQGLLYGSLTYLARSDEETSHISVRSSRSPFASAPPSSSPIDETAICLDMRRR